MKSPTAELMRSHPGGDEKVNILENFTANYVTIHQICQCSDVHSVPFCDKKSYLQVARHHFQWKLETRIANTCAQQMQKPSLDSLQSCIFQITNFRERVMYFGYVAMHFGSVLICSQII